MSLNEKIDLKPYLKMNELEATGRYLLKLNNIYKNYGLAKALWHELKSTSNSLLIRSSAICDFFEYLDVTIGYGLGNENVMNSSVKCYYGNEIYYRPIKEVRTIEQIKSNLERKAYRYYKILNP